MRLAALQCGKACLTDQAALFEAMPPQFVNPEAQPPKSKVELPVRQSLTALESGKPHSNPALKRWSRNPLGKPSEDSWALNHQSSNLIVSKATLLVIIDHSDGLHKRIADRRAHKFESALLEILAQ